MKEVIVDKYVGEIKFFQFPKIPLQLCIIFSVKNMRKTEFYRVWKMACKDAHVSLIIKPLCKNWDRFLYMGLLGTKTSFIFVKCISNWPQYSLQNDDLTVIFCKKFFSTLFNISKTIIAVRKLKEVFVDGPLKNIKLL